MADRALHLVHVQLDLPRLMRRAHSRGQALEDLDTGYLLHAWLGETFGPDALRPFVVEHGPGSLRNNESADLRLLAWSDRGAERLRADAQVFASPDAHGVCRWDELASKELPGEWASGRRLGFAVRVCPTVRTRTPPPGRREKKSYERDAFLAELPSLPEDRSGRTREQVYRDWLRIRMERDGVVRVSEVRLDGFRRRRLHRRTQGENRKGRSVDLPEAWMAGELEIADPARFTEWLRAGVGRHRAFGFGMVLLRSGRS